ASVILRLELWWRSIRGGVARRDDLSNVGVQCVPVAECTKPRQEPTGPPGDWQIGTVGTDRTKFGHRAPVTQDQSSLSVLGGVVIQQRLRSALGVLPGVRALPCPVGVHVEIYFLPEPHTRSLKGALRPFITRRPADDLDDTDAAWESAANEREPRRGE